jgi:hypothetical protein
MKRVCIFAVLCWLVWPLLAAERSFDFSHATPNEAPKGFRSVIAGKGDPGDWRVVFEEVPSLMPSITGQAPKTAKEGVLAQLSKDGTDEHFPLLIFDEETYGDFTFTARFKTVSGEKEQMAGLAFRIQDEKNFYVVRASALGNTFKFYKVVNGERSAPIGPEVEVTKNVWHEISVECKGNRIRCQLDGKELIPMLTDYSFNAGKIGFWTKSDSVSYFCDARLTYTPRESLAKVLIRDQMKKYPRLLGLKIFAATGTNTVPSIVASDKSEELGLAGGKVERTVISSNQIYYGKIKGDAVVTYPLHDRNGDAVAAVRVVMQSFKGQTEENAVTRAMPIVKGMEWRVRSKAELIEN